MGPAARGQLVGLARDELEPRGVAAAALVDEVPLAMFRHWPRWLASGGQDGRDVAEDAVSVQMLEARSESGAGLPGTAGAEAGMGQAAIPSSLWAPGRACRAHARPQPSSPGSHRLTPRGRCMGTALGVAQPPSQAGPQRPGQLRFGRVVLRDLVLPDSWPPWPLCTHPFSAHRFFASRFLDFSSLLAFIWGLAGPKGQESAFCPPTWRSGLAL